MVSRYYTVPYTGTLTNAGGNADLLEVLPADDKPVYLVGLRLAQTSDVGDAAAEGLSITIETMTATVTSGSGGSAVTPAQTPRAQQAAGFAAECNNSTVATTSGATTVRDEIGWMIQNSPYETWWPDEQMQFCAVQGEGLIIRCNTTVADDITISMTFYLREEG